MKMSTCFAMAAFSAVAAFATVERVSPGEILMLKAEWDRDGVPLSVYVRPKLFARDADGKVVWSGNVGAYFQHAVNATPRHRERWSVAARVASDDPAQEKESLARFSPNGLASVTLPSAAREIEFKIAVEGGDFIPKGATAVVERVRGKMVNRRYDFGRLICDGLPEPLGDAELDARLAARPKDRIELSPSGDRTVARLNGEAFIPRIYKLGEIHDADEMRKLPAVFAKCGFNLFVVPFDIAADTSDEAAECIRKELRERLRYAPDAHFMLALKAAMWDGWGEANPSEVFRDENGKYGLMRHVLVNEFADEPKTFKGSDGAIRRPAFSYASEKFAAAVGERFARIIRALDATPEGKALAGVYIGGGLDGQWFDLFDRVARRVAADYSGAALKGFRAYLRKKYGNAADPGAEIPPTARFWSEKGHFAEHGHSPESDYREFLAYATAKFTGTLASAIRDAAGGRLLVGGYYSNAGLSGYPKISLAGLAFRFAANDGWDFTAIVPTYAREFADPVMSSIFNGSFVRRGKLYVSEMDLRNPEAVNWKFWGSPQWTENHSVKTFRIEVLKHALAALTAGGGYHAYDMNGNWFSTTNAMAVWREANAIAESARPMPALRDGIALVGGERYFDFQSFGEQNGRLLSYALRDNIVRSFAYCGLPHANHLVEELIDSPDAEMPRVVVFGDISTIGPDTFRSLRRRYARDGRVLVYTWRPGLFAAGGEQIEKELGLRPSGAEKARYIVADGASPDRLTEGLKGRMVASFAPWGVALVEGLVPDGDRAGWKEIARFEGTGTGGMFVRRGRGCTEVYLAHPAALTPALCRNLAKEAGFLPLLESDDLSGCGSHILYFVALSEGRKRFRAPAGYRPGRVLAGPRYSRSADGAYDVELKLADVFAVELEEVL